MSAKCSYQKIRTRIQGFARKMNPIVDMPVFYGLPYGQTANDESLANAAIQQPVKKYLEIINAKLDGLIGMQAQKRLEDDFEVAIDVIRISGGFACFFARADYETGDKLELALILSQYPMQMATAVTRIIKKTVHEKDNLFEVKFLRIRNTDKEAIVRFVFQEEREQIREQKWSENNE